MTLIYRTDNKGNDFQEVTFIGVTVGDVRRHCHDFFKKNEYLPGVEVTPEDVKVFPLDHADKWPSDGLRLDVNGPLLEDDVPLKNGGFYFVIELFTSPPTGSVLTRTVNVLGQVFPVVPTHPDSPRRYSYVSPLYCGSMSDAECNAHPIQFSRNDGSIGVSVSGLSLYGRDMASPINLNCTKIMTTADNGGNEKKVEDVNDGVKGMRIADTNDETLFNPFDAPANSDEQKGTFDIPLSHLERLPQCQILHEKCGIICSGLSYEQVDAEFPENVPEPKIGPQALSLTVGKGKKRPLFIVFLAGSINLITKWSWVNRDLH